MKIVFLDEYTVFGRDTSKIATLGEYIGYSETTTDAMTVERCRDAEVIITNKVVITDEIMAQLPVLRLICIAATGMNNVDLEAAARRGIKVRNAVGYSTDSVAEVTLGYALSLLREIPYYDDYVKSGGYAASTRHLNLDRKTVGLRGKKWGIIGMGNIGRRVAQLATAFDCPVKYFSTSGVKREEAYEAVNHLTELLRWADVVSIHTPLNDQTRNLITRERIAEMSPQAILINVARGGIVDEKALADALNNQMIRGAVLDVFATEPIAADSPLLKLNDPYRLIMTPHNAWATAESIDNLLDCCYRNIQDYMTCK